MAQFEEPDEQQQESEQNEESEVEVKERGADSEQRRSSFGFGEGSDQEELVQEFENLGGDEGVDLDESETVKVPDDTPIDDLGQTGATDSDRELGEAPSESESDSESENHQPESSEAQTEDQSTDIDPEILDIVQENPEKVKNLQKWNKELTERAQAISDLERLDKVRRLASQDPGRAQKLAEVVERMADGEFDSDKEVEIERPEIPESYQDTEAEEMFESVFEQNQQLAEQVNFLKQQLQQQYQTQQQQPETDIGQNQGTPATDEVPEEFVEEEIQEYENFLDNHPELMGENGEPTEALQQIQQRMAKGGGVFNDWEEAYYSVLGDEVVQENKQSQKLREEQKKKNQRTAPSTSEMTSSNGDQVKNSNSDNPLLSNNGPVSEIRRALERRS